MPYIKRRFVDVRDSPEKESTRGWRLDKPFMMGPDVNPMAVRIGGGERTSKTHSYLFDVPNARAPGFFVARRAVRNQAIKRSQESARTQGKPAVESHEKWRRSPSLGKHDNMSESMSQRLSVMDTARSAMAKKPPAPARLPAAPTTKTNLAPDRVEDITSGVAATAATTVGNARLVSMAQGDRARRKVATADGRAARAAKAAPKIERDGIGTELQRATADAKAAAAAQSSRSTRKAAQADGKASRGPDPATTPKTVERRTGLAGRTTGAIAQKAAAARDASGRFVKNVKTNASDTVRGVTQGQTAGAKIQRGLAVASPYMLAASGYVASSTAWDAAIKSGGTKAQAATAAAVAAAPAAAAAVAPTLIGRFAPKLATTLSKAALPLTIAAAGIGAARGGYESYMKGDGAATIAGKSALGAVDALTFGLASHAVNKLAGSAGEKPLTAPRPTSFAAAVGGGKLTGTDRSASGQTAASNTPMGQAVAKDQAPASRSSYTTVDGKPVDGTKAQIEAWRKRRTMSPV